jgi:hypothetical protein
VRIGKKSQILKAVHVGIDEYPVMKAVPQGLKPSSEAARFGTAKAVPFVQRKKKLWQKT